MKKATFLLLLTSLCRLAFGQVDIHLHPSNTFVNMVMSPEDYADWKDNDRFNAESTYKTNQLYAKFEDDFDFIIFLLNEPNIPANINYYGKHYTVSNEIEGIGKPIYSNAPSYGSTEKLKGVVQMTKKNYLTDGPFLHELSHQWGNSILTTGTLNNNNYAGHWGFTGDVSEGQLGGFDQSTLIENVDGISNKYSVTHFGINANGGNTVLYSQKELYVMGLIPASEIPDFDLFRDITSSQVIDGKNVFIADTKIEYTGAKIISTLSEDRSQENFVKDLNVGLFSGTESATNVQLFPNPIHNTLNIQLHERLESNTKVIISNTEGQIVSESFVNPGIENIVLDISNLSSGVYAVTISNDGFTHSELITKTN